MRVVTRAGSALLASVMIGTTPWIAAADDVLATVGAKSFTRAEIEALVKPKLIEIEAQKYEVLREGLDEAIAQELFTLEAAARKITPEQLEEDEIAKKVPVPSDAEIQKLYDDNKEDLQGQTLEQVKPQIVEYLKAEKGQARRLAFIAELKAKYKTVDKLKAPTVEVATAGRPERGGGAKATVTIVEFSDYQCPFCKRGEDAVQKVFETYGDKVRIVFRDYPLPFHERARPAAEAAACANAQGKFWEYNKKLFANQSALGDDNLKQYAKELGLDAAKFDECYAKKPHSAAIDKDLADGVLAGVNGTPAFFINGRAISGAQPFEKFKEIIDEELAAAAAKPAS
ncbi:MAG: thioredoxin domain-containing protein [Deltaproteobacteria bacterium]|nr:thioredoxin domain-containing protein [Deltaproteobacteria bacterium]